MESLAELIQQQQNVITALRSEVSSVKDSTRDPRRPSRIGAVAKEYDHLRETLADIRGILNNPEMTRVNQIEAAIEAVFERRLEFLRLYDSHSDTAARYFMAISREERDAQRFVVLAAKAAKATPPPPRPKRFQRGFGGFSSNSPRFNNNNRRAPATDLGPGRAQ
ncbi:hypothetical protein J8273_6815 [Carpediemonas membranifera]|uniref:Uncharacterized protein n=1 Tax=Carpediemonas membranifera TaxID=201153 RepID=A0A8J6AQU4_9EUKA|nr:hypothetical protein J8273_6815 [Carpediemonas membranifera]|eukprot:KAG9391891.1 hypothetical protein J8273_6815 [Carpediemonas membranifera]